MNTNMGVIQFVSRQRERILFMLIGAAIFQMLMNASDDQSENIDMIKPEIGPQQKDHDDLLEHTIRLHDIGVEVEHSREILDDQGDSEDDGVDPDSEDSRDVPGVRQPGTGPLKTILFWNSFFHQDSYGLGGFGQGAFFRGQCKVDTCETTNDRSKMATAEAVIVHAGYGIRVNNSVTLPQRSHPNQIFVFFEFEPPLLLRTKLDNMNDLFNLTFTYLNHPDTDIYAPYGIIHEGQRKAHPYRPLTPSALRAKTKKVAWMVSDCFPASKRMLYAIELGKHINVDIYGKCGMDICPRDSLNCSKRIENDYKFYLAFENSVCDGYVTEKTFKMMYKHQLVPIVLGGANYSQHVPEHSVIDVRDYPSPKHLAQYLLELDKDDEKYLAYFEWKKHYYVETAPRIKGFCKLCEILHQDNYVYKKNFNVSDYWNPSKSCYKGMAEKKITHLWGL